MLLLSATDLLPCFEDVSIRGADLVPAPVQQGRMDDSLLGWAIDPSEITISQRKDGSDWVLGAGTYGKVRVAWVKWGAVRHIILCCDLANQWLVSSSQPAETLCMHCLCAVPPCPRPCKRNYAVSDPPTHARNGCRRESAGQHPQGPVQTYAN